MFRVSSKSAAKPERRKNKIVPMRGPPHDIDTPEPRLSSPVPVPAPVQLTVTLRGKCHKATLAEQFGDILKQVLPHSLKVRGEFEHYIFAALHTSARFSLLYMESFDCCTKYNTPAQEHPSVSSGD